MNRIVVGLAVLSFVPGCGALPRAPTVPGDDDFEPVGDTTPRGLDSDLAQALALAAGDIVTLRMQSLDTEEIAGLSVDERGMIHVPLAGDVSVGGLPLTAAEQEIEQAMVQFVPRIRVTIIITEALGHQATVIGAVQSQGRVAVVPGMRVADLLAAAGGPATSDEGGTASIADLHLARLVREGEAVPVSIARAITGDRRHNVRIRGGDHLYVPARLRTLVSVLGEVHAASVFAHWPGLRLSQALALAGGLTRDANGGDVRIVRGPTENPTVYSAPIAQVVSGDYSDPVLAPGDIVFVGSSALADFRDAMSAIAPIVSVGSSTAVGLAIGLQVR